MDTKKNQAGALFRASPLCLLLQTHLVLFTIRTRTICTMILRKFTISFSQSFMSNKASLGRCDFHPIRVFTNQWKKMGSMMISELYHTSRTQIIACLHHGLIVAYIIQETCSGPCSYLNNVYLMRVKSDSLFCRQRFSPLDTATHNQQLVTLAPICIVWYKDKKAYLLHPLHDCQLDFCPWHCLISLILKKIPFIYSHPKDEEELHLS